MADYAKKTNKELQEILESRGLPTSGKKADLVARLNEADKQAEPSSVTDAAPEAEAPATTESIITNQQNAESTDQTNATSEPKAEATEETKSYALHLAASDVDREMEKRKARAERFKTGTQSNSDATTTETATVDSEALKTLERAKRFGTGQNAIGMLDDALPMERERGRGKKGGPATEKTALDDPGLKKNFAKSGRFGNRKNGNGSKPTGVVKSTSSAYSSDKDRQAAEARKKRFAQS